jgi:hypothetical protein
MVIKFFFAALYELVTGQQTDLAKFMYDSGTYIPAGIVMLLVSVLGVALYYYAINHPRFNRWFHWLIVLVVLCLINFGIAWAMAAALITENYGTTEGYITEIAIFGIANVIWTFVSSIVFSLIIKWGSRNCKYSPFIKF